MGIHITTDRKELSPTIFHDLIRIGNKSDGGYLVPKSALEGLEILVTFGIGSNWTFEDEIQSLNPLLKIYGYDNTISVFYFLRKTLKGLIAILVGKITKKDLMMRIWRFLKFIIFWKLNKFNKHHHSRITEKNAANIINDKTNNRRFGLKIDIEESEFVVLPEVISLISNCNFLIVEFHNIDKNNNEFRLILEELSNFTLISHTHCNNFDGLGMNNFPKTLEITFVNKKFSQNEMKRKVLPIKDLDFPNARNCPDYLIEFQ